MKMNCWQEIRCGRSIFGAYTSEKGVCPAAIEKEHNGKNSGKNAGRYCWKVAGSFCSGKVECFLATKLNDCTECDFYKLVQQEEGADFLE